MRTTTAAAGLLTAALSAAVAASAAEAPPLQLEATIVLGAVSGRIDHMAADLKRRRLFVAELGNDTVGVVDLAERKLLRRLGGLKEPQGVGYEPVSDTVYVANARDGSVNLFQGADLGAAGTIALGADADNIRIDPNGSRVVIGYGKGALAIIDPASRRKTNEIAIAQHPEGFQLDADTSRIFVNVPDARSIVVVDTASAKQVAAWPQAGRDGNFPMALDPARRQVLAVFRRPAVLAVFAMADGAPVAQLPVCGDSDDVFVDARRQRAYVSCGEGFVDVIDLAAAPITRIAHIPTASGARTALFIPDLDRLAIAVPARGATPAAIWLYRPMP
jgi:DNA-binding beta-propeller fold protein YncE